MITTVEIERGETAADQKIMKRIAEQFEKLGGMTAELSQKWDVTELSRVLHFPLLCYIL